VEPSDSRVVSCFPSQRSLFSDVLLHCGDAVGNENTISLISVIKSKVMKLIITLIVVALLVILLTSAIWKNRRLEAKIQIEEYKREGASPASLR
jgi:hypothetical protein